MDDKQQRGPQDAARINVNEDYELQYWTKKFNVTADRLKEAVQKAGISAMAVEEYLKSGDPNA